MRRLLLALLAGLALSLPAAAQTVLRVQFVYNADANAFWSGLNVTPAAMVNAVVQATNTSLSGGAVNGSIVSAGVAYFEAKPLTATDVYQQVGPTSLSIALADLAQANNADIIVAVTQHNFPQQAAGGSWTGNSTTDAINNVIVIDASKFNDATSLLYWLGRQMGTKNQRAGGVGNETTGNAHGYWMHLGNSGSACEQVATVDTVSIDPTFTGTCAGYLESWNGYLRECNAAANCQKIAQHQGPLAAGCGDCNGWTAWTGTSVPTATGQACTVTAHTWWGTTWGYGPENATAVVGPYTFICANKTQLTVFSSPTLTYKGQPLGDSSNDGLSAITSNIAAKANTHNLNRPALVRANGGS